MDHIFLSDYVRDAQQDLFTHKNLPPVPTVDAYILTAHVGYLLAATLLLSLTPHIIFPSLVAVFFGSAANFQVYMLATNRNRSSIRGGTVLRPRKPHTATNKEEDSTTTDPSNKYK
jgi:hypothetical protein